MDGDGDLDRVLSPETRFIVSLPSIQLNLHQQVATSGSWGLGKAGHVEIFGHQGDGYLLLAGRKGKDLKVPGLGLWRLDPAGMVSLQAGVLPRDSNRVNGQEEWVLKVPRDPALLDGEIWFQAVMWRKGKGLFLSGADRGRVTNF